MAASGGQGRDRYAGAHQTWGPFNASFTPRRRPPGPSFGSPEPTAASAAGAGLYSILSDELIEDGISSLRLHYRKPNNLPHSHDGRARGSELPGKQGLSAGGPGGAIPFGGAVVIAAAPMSDTVVTVVGLASQTYGAKYAHMVSPRPLLLVHGQEDDRLSPRCSILINEIAKEPKRLELYQGAGHNLRERP